MNEANWGREEVEEARRGKGLHFYRRTWSGRGAWATAPACDKTAENAEADCSTFQDSYYLF